MAYCFTSGPPSCPRVYPRHTVRCDGPKRLTGCRSSALAYGSEQDWLADKQNSRPPAEITPRKWVGYQSFTPPASVSYDCDEGCDGAALRFILLFYHGLRQSSSGIADTRTPRLAESVRQWVLTKEQRTSRPDVTSAAAPRTADKRHTSLSIRCWYLMALSASQRPAGPAATDQGLDRSRTGSASRRDTAGAGDFSASLAQHLPDLPPRLGQHGFAGTGTVSQVQKQSYCG